MRSLVLAVELHEGVARIRITLDGHLPVTPDHVSTSVSAQPGTSMRIRFGCLLKGLVQSTQGDDGALDGIFGVTFLQDAASPKGVVEEA